MLVNPRTVYKAVHYQHSNTAPRGRPVTQGRQDLADAAENIINEEGPQHSIQGMANRLMAPESTMRRVIKEDLGLKSLRRTKRHDPGDTDARLLKSLIALDWLEDLENANRDLVFSDEKVFECNESSNPAAQRYLAPSLSIAQDTVPDEIRHVRKKMHAKHLTAYVALYSSGQYFLKIYPPGATVNSESYIQCLEEQLEWQIERFGDPLAPDAPVFTQDGATPHTSNVTQAWLREHYGPNFWDKNMWPPRSPDFNPLDARAWGTMDARLCSEFIPTTYEELENAIRTAAESLLTPEYIRNICSLDKAKNVLRAIINNNGGNVD